jgi:hypothetical protein
VRIDSRWQDDGLERSASLKSLNLKDETIADVGMYDLLSFLMSRLRRTFFFYLSS